MHGKQYTLVNLVWLCTAVAIGLDIGCSVCVVFLANEANLIYLCNFNNFIENLLGISTQFSY